jgi:hypothetical protein
MKLFRTAFWLGIVIYNLPNPASGPAAPEAKPNSTQRVAVKKANHCPQALKSCAEYVEALPKPGEPGGLGLSREALRPSQDTLAPADRAVLWRRPAAVRSRDRARHDVIFS